MTIPKSYEALAADLASEKIISKTLQGQKESYMMLADGRKFDLDAIQQRLTVAEQRVDLLEGLLKSGSSPTYAHCSAVMEALKPAAEPEHICKGCGSKGWTANCAQCVPY